MIEHFDVFEDQENDCFQLRTKTTSYALEFDSEEKEQIFLRVVEEIKKQPEIALKSLKNKVQNGNNEAQVIDVLSTLNEYGMLPYGMAAEFGDSENGQMAYVSSDRKGIAETVLSIFGDGDIAQKIQTIASAQAFKEIRIYSYEKAKDIEPIVSSSDFVIVDANTWSPFHLEWINQYALKYNTPWLYVGGIEEFSIKVGPLFYGRETGCYHCLISRIKSNHEYPEFLGAYENYLREHQRASQPDQIPASHVIYEIVASYAVLEVVKFFEEWSLPATWRKVVNLEIATLNTSKHTLLKKPFCEVCKPELEYNPAPWLEAVTLK